jgi:hypothetical protein
MDEVDIQTSPMGNADDLNDGEFLEFDRNGLAPQISGGQCYYFRRFSAIFGDFRPFSAENFAFFSKLNVMIQFLQKFAEFKQNTPFFRQFLLRKYIITSVTALPIPQVDPIALNRAVFFV